MLSQLQTSALHWPSCFYARTVGQQRVVGGGGVVVVVVVEEEACRVVEQFVFLEARQHLFTPLSLSLFHSC